MVNKKLIATAVVVLLMLGACSLPTEDEPSNLAATAAAATLTALQSIQTPPPSDTPLPPPTETSIPLPTATPQNPLVLRDTLCWVGPGPVYEVVSSLKKDTRVPLLGRASTGDWWIVDNPIYHDPCWVMAKDIQIEPGTDVVNLQVFTAPPTPTFTPKPPTATYTPTP